MKRIMKKCKYYIKLDFVITLIFISISVTYHCQCPVILNVALNEEDASHNIPISIVINCDFQAL